MKHEELIKKHLGIHTPQWIINNVQNLINEIVESNNFVGETSNIGIICLNIDDYLAWKAQNINIINAYDKHFSINKVSDLCSKTLNKIYVTNNAYKNPNIFEIIKMSEINLIK